MAIVKMNKFMLLAFENQKKSLLEKLQSLENIQFSDLNKEKSEELTELKEDSSSIEISEVEGKLSKLGFTIDILEKFEEKPNMLKALKEGKKAYTYSQLKKITDNCKWKDIYFEIQQKDKKINQNTNHISKLKGNIEELRPWINFDVDIKALSELKSSKIILGTIPNLDVDNVRLSFENDFKEVYFEVISNKGKECYAMVMVHNSKLSECEQLLKQHNFSKIELHCEGLPKDTINLYEENIEELNLENKDINEEIKSYLVKLDELKAVYEYYSCYKLRLQSTENFLKSNTIVAIEGYYPSEFHNKFEKAIKEVVGENYYLESTEADGDDVPVKLKNNALFECFESITTMYSTPNYKEIDPTPLFAPFYILFFGMMLSDAGYGILMTLGTLIALKFFNLDDDMKKSMKMFCFLGISTIIWGFMYGSFFGDFIEIPALWIKPDKDVTLLMLVSIGIGLVQILMGLGIKGYLQIRDKDYFGAFSDVFLWYVTLLGCIIWGGSAFGVALPATLVTISKYSAIAAMVGIVLTNGRDAESIGGKLGQGLYSLYGITSYVGDLISYSRLAALGLATGFISYAFNVMVDMVSMNLVTTILFGGLIFIVGHVFNLFINALGSYVHACRLQYLEYFGKFYEGGGHAFEPLKYNSKYFKIIEDEN